MQGKKRKACFVVPYFGDLPDCFDIFLRTCEKNADFDWLIFTDDDTGYAYPKNVHVQHLSFEAFRDKVQSHFSFTIALPRAYKICDFRAAFGEIFEDELKEYRFWGHCDLDQYFGMISHFITEEILNTYDKILCLGHFTLFRNTPHINAIYRIADKKSNQSYLDAFSDGSHWIFDEWPPPHHTSSNRIFKQEGIKTWICPQCFCDLQPFKSTFRRTLFDYEAEFWTNDSIKSEVYIWNNGILSRCYSLDDKLVCEEVLYVHIRQRKMKYTEYDCTKGIFLIIPNRFISVNHLTEKFVLRTLHSIRQRSILHPDEIRRGWVLFQGRILSAFRKVKNL